MRRQAEANPHSYGSEKARRAAQRMMEYAESEPMPTTRPVTINGITMDETLRQKKEEYRRWRAELEAEAAQEVQAQEEFAKGVRLSARTKERSRSPTSSPYTRVSSATSVRARGTLRCGDDEGRRRRATLAPAAARGSPAPSLPCVRAAGRQQARGPAATPPAALIATATSSAAGARVPPAFVPSLLLGVRRSETSRRAGVISTSPHCCCPPPCGRVDLCRQFHQAAVKNSPNPRAGT